MVAKGHLDVKVAVHCDAGRKPIAGLGLFHEKAGILKDGAGNRLALCDSINETEFGWKHNWESFHPKAFGAFNNKMFSLAPMGGFRPLRH